MMNRISAKLLLPFMLGTGFAYSAHAACPFGADCKPQPCGVAKTTTAVSGYAPSYAPAYGSATAAGTAYQGNNAGAPFSAGSTYSQPPCDPNVVPEKQEPLIVPIPLPEPDTTNEDGEEQSSADDA